MLIRSLLLHYFASCKGKADSYFVGRYQGETIRCCICIMPVS
ncbi:hypothetical protein IMSAG013_01528 [Clostridiales bacterium]|nr:hypothetical protein IMSAG013_01528 [Clostridiales bacterium]